MIDELEILTGSERSRAEVLIKEFHYTHSIPSGKSHWMRYGDAIVVWSIPANPYVAKFLAKDGGIVWELSRLWAPDGHDRNLLTQAISRAVKEISKLEHPDILVSYADPSQSHKGGVYKAASWILHGQCEETRAYRGPQGEVVARRKFHSGTKSLKKAEIEALGYREVKLPGKLRFVKPLTKSSRKLFAND